MKERTKLIELRNNKDLKQKHIAKAVEITTSYYGMIEQGVRTPTLEVAKKIADFFETTVEDLFFEERNNSLLNGGRSA